MIDLHDKVVMITGGSSGIGKAVALQAAAAGATVVVAARNMAKLAQVRSEAARLSGTSAYAYVLDVSDPVAIESTCTQVIETLGRVDYLLNAAGFGAFEEALATDMRTTESMFRTNVLGSMYMCRIIGRDMVKNGGGHIINIGSMAGKIPTPKSAVYAATKAAVIAYSDALRMELRPAGVYVTSVNPGPVKTDFFKTAHAEDYEQKVDLFAINPDHLARQIVAAFGRPVREINAPFVMAVAAKVYPLFPHVGDYLAGTIFNRK